MTQRTFRVYRGTREKGKFKEYTVQCDEGMVVLDAIHRIQAEQAPHLACRWNCKAGKCGSCSAEVNGMPRLMCMTRLSDYRASEPLTITPMKAGNRIILEWVVNGEGRENMVYVVTRNDVMLTDSSNSGKDRWAGTTAHPYDYDNQSTTDNAVVRIIDTNTLAVQSTYKLLVRSSNNTVYTFKLNRTFSSAGSDTHEATLSTGIAQEIWW